MEDVIKKIVEDAQTRLTKRAIEIARIALSTYKNRKLP